LFSNISQATTYEFRDFTNKIIIDRDGFGNAMNLQTPNNVINRKNSAMSIKQAVAGETMHKLSDTVNGRSLTNMKSKQSLGGEASSPVSENQESLLSLLSEKRSQVYDEVAAHDFDVTQWELAVQVSASIQNISQKLQS